MVFDAAWFARWQWLLLAILDEPLLGRWLRWVLCIRPCDVGHRGRIVQLLPHAYLVADGDTYTADVRTHAKYAKRLYHACRPLWWTLHAWDALVANPLRPAWNIGFDTLTAYPDAHPEFSTVDGVVARSANESWATIRAGAGNLAFDDQTLTAVVILTSSVTLNQWTLLSRFIALFDTSLLTADAVISAAVLSLAGGSKSDGLSVTPNVDIYTSAPASNSVLVGADYTTLGATSQTGAPIAYASFNAAAYNAFTFNSTGRGNISKTGISKFGARNANYDVAAVAPTWSSNQTSQLIIACADEQGTSVDPKLVITFTIPTTAVTHLTVAGVEYGTGRLGAAKVIHESLTITDGADAQPSTCLFTTTGIVPTVGQPVVVTLGTLRVFAGTIGTVTQDYLAENPINVAAHVTANDHTVGLNRLKVSARFTATSATVIAQQLIATYAGAYGYTSAGVAAGLDAIDEITFTNQDLTDCLTQLAKRIGAYWYCDYFQAVHLFVGESGNNPAALTPSSGYLRSVTSTQDLSQVVTRVLVEGGGVNALGEVAAGETILPVEDLAWYDEAGGTVVAGPQRITYTGLNAANPGGGLVGPGALPSAGPTLALAVGAGVNTGAHDYAVTFVTAAGESLPSPRKSITTVAATTAVTPPPTPWGTGSNFGTSGGGALLPNTLYDWGVSFVTATGETPLRYGSFMQGFFPLDFPYDAMFITNIPVSGDARVTARRLWRKKQATGKWHVLTTIPNNTTTSFTDDLGEGALGALVNPDATAGTGLWGADTTGVAARNQVALTGIPIGAAGVTSRKVYRTVAAGSQLKLLTTIANNTATTYADSTADASLGANVPVVDASGLSQPSGQVIAGETTLIVAGTGAFDTGGGWAIIGNGQQVIRYTGITVSSLTGIPATGAGSITAAVSYNSTVTPAPALIGIPATGTGAIRYALKKGDPVNVLVTVNDLGAQASLATLRGGGDDGIQEGYLQDRRISITEAQARGLAELTLRGRVEASIRYDTRDPLTRAGRTISVNMPAPTNIVGDFKIQRVTISQFDPKGLLYPNFAVEASTTRFSLEDLLRLARR